MSKEVFVLGGDGFCGWATSLHLAARGYDIVIIDNLSRRCIDQLMLSNSLTPIRDIQQRLACWNKLRRPEQGWIEFIKGDIRKADFEGLLNRSNIVGVVHFAEQRAAPYSMVEPEYTVENNIIGTHRLLHCIAKLKETSGKSVPIVHLGTTGVYGYGEGIGGSIPEGYIEVLTSIPSSFDSGDSQRRPMEIVFPYNPGSVYHMTKCMDNLMFQYYAKNWGLQITDLHQGVVWGTQTEETALSEDLINRFDYDGMYGTVLNRFISQAAGGHPLTVYGTGGQTRAFIHIRDTVQCVRCALEHPADPGRVAIINQLAETANILHLAQEVSRMTGAEIRFYKNQRNEAVKNALSLKNDTLLQFGIKPMRIKDYLYKEVDGIANKYKNRLDHDLIMMKALWNNEKEFDIQGRK